MDPFCRSSLRRRYAFSSHRLRYYNIRQSPPRPFISLGATTVLSSSLRRYLYLCTSCCFLALTWSRKIMDVAIDARLSYMKALHYYYVGPPMRRTLLLRTRLMMISEIESYQVPVPTYLSDFCSLCFCNNSAKMGFCLCDSRAIASLLQSA